MSSFKRVGKACLRPIYHLLVKPLGRPALRRLRDYLDFSGPLHVQMAAQRAQLQVLSEQIAAVQQRQESILAQEKSHQEVVQSTDRMLLALLKSAQLSRLN